MKLLIYMCNKRLWHHQLGALYTIVGYDKDLNGCTDAQKITGNSDDLIIANRPAIDGTDVFQ